MVPIKFAKFIVKPKFQSDNIHGPKMLFFFFSISCGVRGGQKQMEMEPYMNGKAVKLIA